METASADLHFRKVTPMAKQKIDENHQEQLEAPAMIRQERMKA